MAIRGAGFGLSSIPATTAGMAALPEHRLVEGSVLNDLIEQIISSVAIVICLLVFVVCKDVSVTNRHLTVEAANLQVSNGMFVVLAVLTFIVLFYWRNSLTPAATRTELS